MDLTEYNGIEEADKALQSMMDADNAAAAAEAGKGAADPASVDPTAAHAGQPEGKDVQAAPADGAQQQQAQPAPKAADAATGDDKSKDGKTDDGKPAEKQDAGAEKKSRYQKAQDRLQGGWSELNTAKQSLDGEREALKREREKLDTDRHEFQARREEAEQEFTPEKYEAAAKKFEAEGKLEFADLARARAEELRKNPPAQREGKAKAATEAQRKEWTLKAGVDFPELAKANSPLQVRVAQLLKEEADLAKHPKGIYLASRLASLEAEAGKAKDLESKLSAKDKELGTLQAKVKELETLTAPGGPGGAAHLPGAKTFEQMNDTEQFQDLERQANELGSLRS